MVGASLFKTRTYLLTLLLSIIWWAIAAGGDRTLFAAYIAPSLLGLAVGASIGFLFSSYGEEQGSIGKVRDWILGALTGITIAEIMERGNMVKAGIQHFVPPTAPDGFGTVVCMMVVYATLGFFGMFFNRELIWNPMLARSRAARQQLEQLGATVVKKLAQVETTMLLTDDPSKPQEAPPAQLNSPPVTAFIKAAEEVQDAGDTLDFAQLSRLANLYYFRQEYAKAIPHLRSALDLKPQDPDLTTKLAWALAELGQRDEAVNLLETLVKRPAAPIAAFRSLGYHLLWYENRIEEAASYSEKYLAVAPGDSGARMNLACAYAQLFGQGKEEYKARALAALEQAVNQSLVWRERARELAQNKAGDFWELRGEKEFLDIVRPDAEAASAH